MDGMDGRGDWSLEGSKGSVLRRGEGFGEMRRG